MQKALGHRYIDGFEEYRWYDEGHFEQIRELLAGLVAGQDSRIPSVDAFLRPAIIQRYNSDRATRAVALFGADGPLKYEQIPQWIEVGPGGPGVLNCFYLERTGLNWSSKIPLNVFQAVSSFTKATPPDGFWIANYTRERYKTRTSANDPIVYAEFGEGEAEAWHVELAPWD